MVAPRYLGLSGVGVATLALVTIGLIASKVRSDFKVSLPPEVDGSGAAVELVAVFVGSATCQYSGSPEVASSWTRAVDGLSREAEDRGLGFHTIGVAIAEQPVRGLKLLETIGSIGEISLGGGWASLGVDHFIARGFPGSAATPQVLVMIRQRPYGGAGVTDEELLLRLVGAEAITRWVEAGLPLDLN